MGYEILTHPASKKVKGEYEQICFTAKNQIIFAKNRALRKPLPLSKIGGLDLLPSGVNLSRLLSNCLHRYLK